MDLLTQAALGGAVGELTLGKKAGNRAVVWGVVGGLLPDFDGVLKWTHGTLTYWLEHRGLTHSLLFVLLVPWLLGWLVKRLEHKRFPELRKRDWGKLFFWVIFTHIALDCCTTWGTQFFYPFWRYRVAFNLVSVIDPLYTVPLLLGLILGLRHAPDTRPRNLWMGAGVVVSTLYLLFAFTNRQFMQAVFANALRQADKKPIRYETYPTLGNNLLWYGVAEEAYGYSIGYHSLINGRQTQMKLLYLPKQHSLPDSLVGPALEDRLQEASHRYYNLEQKGDTMLWHDLRFGLANVGTTYLSPPHFTMTYRLTTNPEGHPEASRAAFPIQPDAKAWGLFWQHIWGMGWKLEKAP